MNLLLDTHIALWMFLGDERLRNDVVSTINNPENIIYISIASVWEVQIKHTLHPEKLSLSCKDFVRYVKECSYRILPLGVEDIYALDTLQRKEDAPRHKDPFDRILLAQAKAKSLLFFTHDNKLLDYGEPCVIKI